MVLTQRWPRLSQLWRKDKHCPLNESGGLAAEKFDLQPGGRVLVRGTWLVIARVNKKDGRTVSVSTISDYVRVRSIEEIQDYTPPDKATAEAVAARSKLPPLCNYPEGENVITMTAAEWKEKSRYDVYIVRTIKATDDKSAHRTRFHVSLYRDKDRRVFITDSKIVYPPKRTAPSAPAQDPAQNVYTLAPERDHTAEMARLQAMNQRTNTPKPPEAVAIDAMREQLKTGVKIVVAPQLFPTPNNIAEEMAELANITAGAKILEPSAGTGALLAPLATHPHADTLDITAIEINHALATALSAKPSPTAQRIICADFTATLASDHQKYDVILMNPPFANGSDISHINHARKFLKPGGRIVAICANGPRQNAALKPIADTWRELPAGTFAGTNVNTALLTING